MHCIQCELKDLHVLKEQIQHYTETTRSVLLGDKEYDFKNEGMYNSQGLSVLQDTIFLCMHTILSIRSDDSVSKEVIESIFENTEFSKILPQLLDTIEDIRIAIIHQTSTRLIEYAAVYDYLLSSLGENLFTQDEFIPRLLMARQVCFSFMTEEQKESHIINTLKNNGVELSQKIFTKEYLSVIKSHNNPWIFMDALMTVYHAHLSVLENFDAIRIHDNLQLFAEAIKILHKTGMLTQENFNAVRLHSDPQTFAMTLTLLHRVKILSIENVSFIKESIDLKTIMAALSILNRTGILNQENFDAIKTHGNPQALAHAFGILYRAGILSAENRHFIKTHHNPWASTDVLMTLHHAKILTPENYHAVNIYYDLQSLATALKILHRAGILNQENFNAIITYKNPQLLANVFKTLYREKMLSVEIRAIVVSHHNPQVYTDTLIALHHTLLNMHKNNLARTPSFFSKKSQSNSMVIRYLVTLYQENGGDIRTTQEIFNEENQTYDQAVIALQAKWNENNQPEEGAIYKTLLSIQQLPDQSEKFLPESALAG